MSTLPQVTLEEVALADEALEGDADLRPGLGARPNRVGKLLNLLATTSRSFLLYDARNDAIRSFLGQLVEGFAETLREERTIRLEVRPFEIAFEGQTVYLNRDRERSLAFRLEFQAPDRTLTDAEIEEAVDRVMRALEQGGGRLRT